MCGLAGERQSVPAGFFGFVSMLRAAHGLRTAFPAFSSAMIFVRLRVWVHAGSDITPKIARCEYGLLSPAAARLFGLKERVSQAMKGSKRPARGGRKIANC